MGAKARKTKRVAYTCMRLRRSHYDFYKTYLPHATDALYQLIKPFLAKIYLKYADRIINNKLQKENDQHKRPLGKQNGGNPERESTLGNKAFLSSAGHSRYTAVETCVHKNIPQEFKSSSERRSGSA